MSELIGITGAIGSGKSSLAKLLTDCEPSHAIYETYQLVAEVANAFNQALKAELEFQTARNDIELANQALVWLPSAIEECLHRDVSWSQLAVKKHATMVRPALYRKLFVYIAMARKKPQLLDKPITAKNKETYRPLLQWIGAYLIAKVGKTVWYDELMRRIKLHDADKNLVVICGVRYPSDAAIIDQAKGRIVAIERPAIKVPITDITEVRRRSIRPDCIVVNNGSLKDLATLAEDLWRDCGAGVVKAKYSAKG